MRRQSAKGQANKTGIAAERGARLKKIAETYLDGLAKRDLSAIPYDETSSCMPPWCRAVQLTL